MMVSAIHQHESVIGMKFIIKILPFIKSVVNFISFPGGASGKEPAC